MIKTLTNRFYLAAGDPKCNAKMTSAIYNCLSETESLIQCCNLPTLTPSTLSKRVGINLEMNKIEPGNVQVILANGLLICQDFWPSYLLSAFLTAENSQGRTYKVLASS